MHLFLSGSTKLSPCGLFFAHTRQNEQVHSALAPPFLSHVLDFFDRGILLCHEMLMSPDSGMVMGMMEKLKAIFKAAGRVLKDALLHSGDGTPLHLGQGAQYKARTVVTLIAPLISQVHPEQQNRAEHVETKEFCPRKRLFPWTRGRDLSVSATNRLHCVDW